MKLRATRRLILFALATLLVSACAGNPKPNTSQLSPTGLIELKVDDVVKVVNDATNGAIAANKAKLLSDDAEKTVLTVNKEVLDVIAANPKNYKQLALAAVRNARDALPPAVDAAVAVYVQKVIDVLLEVR